jgi:hypothetical protein
VTAFVAAAALAVAVLLPGFRSPTGNIRCAARTTPPVVLHCDIGHADYGARLQARCMGPNGEGVDWHGFDLTATGRGRISCAGGIWYGDGEHPRYVTLPYGLMWKAGPFRCASARRGVTCVNGRGHGLFISRGRYRTF